MYKRFLSTKKGIAASVAVVVLLGSLTAGALIQHKETKETNQSSSELIENLEYQTVLPDNKSISQLGGWRRVSPPESDPVYAYVDSIDGVAISVSQQPLPAAFAQGTDAQIAALAKKFNATDKLTAEGGAQFFMGTSAKGPQSVIFTKNGLLILMKSQQKIDTKSWIKYASSLR